MLDMLKIALTLIFAGLSGLLTLLFLVNTLLQQIQQLRVKDSVSIPEDQAKPRLEAWPKRLTLAGIAILGFLLSASFAWFMLFLAGQSATELINDLGSSAWPTTSGHIISSNVEQFQESGDTYFDPRVEYEYAVDERTFRSERIRFGGFVPALPGSTTEANEVILRYPSGASVQVYFYPSDPSLSVLEPGAGKIRIVIILAIWILMLVASCLLAGVCALSAFGRLRRKRK